ncbi:hypothetical protein PT974_04066 [Cladobotryum mycophilum]|uniref:FAD-binding FR-type domain-containing protein n=1 Tax=Cladobotryum mycophilum TaxID=491253 RepID=A0ABR0SU01_9HYPO
MAAAATTAGVQGWHPGEVFVQRKLGYADAVKDSYLVIRNYMPEQHRIFHTSNLPFIPLTTIDEQGRPWASIVAGATGEIGFVKSPDANTLTVNARLWNGDPLLGTVKAWAEEAPRPHRFLTAGLGIEFPTRRRNKFAGSIRDLKALSDLDVKFDLYVNETVGNCPKYINVRQFTPYPKTQPSIAYRNLHMTPSDRLPDDVIQFITSADNVFVGSIYHSQPSTADKFPSHAGMNARAGLPGFIRVSPSNGRSVVVPEYSGNRFNSSLGNIECSGLAAFTMVSFTTGDVLYLTGRTKILIGPPALEIMARHASLTIMETTGYIFIRDALPVRQQPGTEVERSPYSPKVKYLIDEPEAQSSAAGGHKVKLKSAVQLSDDLAVFRFEVATKQDVPGLKIRPGQAIVLDFMDWIGPPEYHHMANSAPGSINDDRVRTWTVSSAHEEGDATWFDMTMREMKGGAVTGALFDVLRKSPANKWGDFVQIDVEAVADVVGVTGDFFLGQGSIRTLWVAGGIGITPFLAMFSALAKRGCDTEADVSLALSTREPELMLTLIHESLGESALRGKIRIDIFTKNEHVPIVGEFDKNKGNMEIILHKGRVTQEYWAAAAQDRDVFICGPGGFGDAAVEGLRAVGVSNDRLHREGFY